MSSESEAAVKSGGGNPPLKALGKYVIERRLGQGGMGTVYLARHTDLKKMIALKVLPQDKAKNPILVRRFKAEAQAAAQLEHPNIVAVYDTGEADGYLYIAMEYVDGIDLFEQVKRRGVIPVKNSIEIIKQVASALQHAFEQNIVHRDIKPSNLLLRQDGTVKVTDLGLARSIDDTLETNITRAGTTVGTVDYMAPEQARNSKSADIRSDIYSLGCTWYQMLTGEPPFPEGSLTNKLQAHAIKPLPDPRDKNENIPEGVYAILRRMTEKKADDRYQSPAELLDDLEHSKLTRAEFSQEIFSDLSDYDVDAIKKYSADESDHGEEADDAPVNDRRSKKRTRSRVEEEADEDAPQETARRRSRPRLDDADEDQPESRRRKSRSVEADSDDEEAESPTARPRYKSNANSDHEDAPRSTKRSSYTPDEEEDEPEEPSSKRRRAALPVEEQRVPSRNNKSSSSGSDKKASKNVARPLPPKRAPEPSSNEEKQSNLEPLKYLAIIGGILGVVVGLGLLVSYWSKPLDIGKGPGDIPPTQTDPVPQQNTATTPVEPDSNNVTVNVVEPPKNTNPTEKPSIEYEIAKQPLPAWATPDISEPRDLAVFSVGPGARTDTHFTSLEDALKSADKSGALIRLLGTGPFVTAPVELNNAKRIVITAAAPQDLPVVILQTNDRGEFGLKLNNGSLDLRSVHFAVDRAANSTAAFAMISVVDGQLFVRNCSFTATGNESVETVACAMTSKDDSQNVPTTEPQVLLDRVTVRGNALTGLQVGRTMSDIVIQDSLFATGSSPALEVSATLIPAMADALTLKPRRTIRILRSTLCARKQAFEFSAEKAPKPPTTAVLLQDSVCTAEGSGNSAVVLSAERWPSASSTTSGWLTNLSWTSLSSLYLGFDRLIDLDKSYKVAGLDTWQRVWSKRFDANQFQPLLWQESLIPDLSSALPYDFDTARLPYHDIKTPKGTMPGCDANRLNVPQIVSAARMGSLSQRPKLPVVVLKPADGPQVKKVDAMKEDLGLILNKNDWQSGTVFEVSGTGLRMMTPAKISGRSLRISAVRGDGPPLKLQPKVPDQKAKPDSLGLFNLDSAQLDLQGVTLEAIQTVKGAAPPWMINAKNSNVILRGCQLNGPLQQDLEQHQGLIQWTTSGTGQSTAGTEVPFLSINDCLLLSTGDGIRAECVQGQIFLRNSIIAVRGNGINLLPIRADNKLLAVLDLEHVTFSTSKAAIRLDSMAGPEPASAPVRVYAEYCAVVPPLEFKAGDATDAAAVEFAGPVLEQRQVEWWGTSNGIAKEIKTFVRQSNAVPINSVVNWQKTWGEANDIRLLTGSKGVQLNNLLPNKWINLKPVSFALDSNCIGATWAQGGFPVGADTRVVDDALMGKKIVKDVKSTSSTGSTQQPTQPPTGGNSKKNPGF